MKLSVCEWPSLKNKIFQRHSQVIFKALTQTDRGCFCQVMQKTDNLQSHSKDTLCWRPQCERKRDVLRLSGTEKMRSGNSKPKFESDCCCHRTGLQFMTWSGKCSAKCWLTSLFICFCNTWPQYKEKRSRLCWSRLCNS